MSTPPKQALVFIGSNGFILLPLGVFLLMAVYLFVFQQAFDLLGLAMGGFIGMMLGALLCKNKALYWQYIIAGFASPLSGTVVAILMASGMFSVMMKSAGVADGLIWLGAYSGVQGGWFCAFTFIATAILATATGSSIGSIFTAVPLFFAAGTSLSADPSMLAGAILSGAIFGDNLAPVSDVTVISASTQRYRRKTGLAELGGVVASRYPYALLAAALILPFYVLFGAQTMPPGNHAFAQGSPLGLIMLLPVAILVYVAIRTQNVFSALIAGLLSGCAIGLLAGRFDVSALLHIQQGQISGFFYTGLANMSSTIMLCLTLFGIAGLFEYSGMLERFSARLSQHAISNSARGAETVMAAGALLSSCAFASVTSAALILFGPIGDEIGGRQHIHPYRRANIMSAMVNSLPVVMPFSAFIFLVMGAISSQPQHELVTPFTLLTATLYPWSLLLVFAFSIYYGIGRRYEGNNGEPSSTPPSHSEERKA
ncbi:hypothetical protein HZU77_006220 [Neisseriaceae bacterium TC5R-5]|nr:hypothetical protein [Neisseriaceae bacterium TC5R-5]